VISLLDILLKIAYQVRQLANQGERTARKQEVIMQEIKLVVLGNLKRAAL
jgi:hypothetical protein